ncbi:hypothetical protein COCVIDRAFT_114690 [Bipolaris victoriae FI3]|uniref:Uncharacterized protein n=1 Tax=Bipolaris victoriae (strain FI3) TaxID=930091 RepID=W7E281_BIPV3|nr:hypothetical protein COCVIDRAFT_114690 [Bipolaris victoriae FI3]
MLDQWTSGPAELSCTWGGREAARGQGDKGTRGQHIIPPPPLAVCVCVCMCGLSPTPAATATATSARDQPQPSCSPALAAVSAQVAANFTRRQAGRLAGWQLSLEARSRRSASPQAFADTADKH